MTKDYYHILGVLDDAEDIVIRAAYKALAQRYHPDKWTGDEDEANRLMSDINEAYAVLSNAIKRKEYDSQRDQHSYQSEPDDLDLNPSVQNDWEEVTKYFPDLIDISTDLRKLSKSLEYTYKVVLLESKKFNSRTEIALSFEKSFLEKYFGTNSVILKFAKQLIVDGEKEAAKELNKAVNLLGSEVDPYIITVKIENKFGVGRIIATKKLASLLLKQSGGGFKFEVQQADGNTHRH